MNDIREQIKALPLKEHLKRYKENTLTGSQHKLFRGVLLCKVTGVSFDNRQEALSKVTNTTPVKLERDRRNEYDFHAVKVLAFVDASWEEVGFVPSSMNIEITSAMDAGVALKAKVWQKTGGQGDYTHGLTITITRD